MIRPETTALVHDWLTIPGGAEEVLRETLALFPGTVFTAQYNPARFPWLKDTVVKDTWVSKMPLSKTRHYLYAPILADVYRRMDLRGFKLILTNSHTFAHHVRKPEGAVHICYYHTPARSLWAPEIDDRAGDDPLRRLIANRLRRLDLEASKNPDVVLANSQTSAERIKRIYKRDVEEVIYPPVETANWVDVERESDDEGYLMWGRLIRYKKIDLAIDAAKLTGARLHIVGAGPYRQKLEERAAGNPKIQFHGRLPDEELKALMARCKAVLFPGYEDFGIVPVEAMAAGLPVVAFGRGGASETVSAECGVQFDEQRPESLVAAMRTLEGRTYEPATLRARAALYDSSVFRAKYKAAVERHAV
ncbi:MAG: hypothetical protein QOJ65_2551 [Fimbriimonadaceae bacterium]|nr:hypothetical protein [Fimbriimonadaceae bacterium]